MSETTFSIRPATQADARGIAQMHFRTWQIAYADFMPADYLARLSLDVFERQWRENVLVDPERNTLVAEEGGRIIGFAGFALNGDNLGDDVGELGGLYVDPDHWDRGVGGRLITEAQQQLAAFGYKRAILWTLADNQRTRRFYESRGWATDGATKSHRSGAPLVRYTRELT